MPRVDDFAPSFNVGELSPRLAARTDFSKYRAGMETCENLVPLSEGALMRRAGTRYVAEIASSAVKGRLKKFQFSTSQAYQLELGAAIMRFFRSQGQVTVADTSASVTNGTFNSAVTGWTDQSTGAASISYDREVTVGVGTWDKAAAPSGALPFGDAILNGKNAGQRIPFDATGQVISVRIETGTPHTQNCTGTVIGIYADDSGSPGSQVGGNSDSQSLAAANTEYKFTWSLSAPSVTSGTSYWVVVTDGSGGTGNTFIKRTTDQGSTYGNGTNDTITSITAANQDEIKVNVSVAVSGSTNGIMSLNGASGETAIAEQSVTTTATGTEHVIKVRVLGDPGDEIKMRIGETSGGVDVVDDRILAVGYHCVAFTPDASPVLLQFRNETAKAIFVDDVSLIDNAALNIDTPYAEADLFSLEGPQTADELYFFHSSYPTHKLQRFGDTSWSLIEVAWQDGPWLPLNSTTTTLTPSATSGVSVTITASAVTGINDNEGFKSTDVGRLVRIDNPASGVAWGWGVITATNGVLTATVDVKKAFGTTNADVRWRLGAWSETTGYPQAATFFEQRLYVAATTNQLQTFWASQTADFENHKPDDDADTVEDDDALDFTLSADDVNAIRWLSAGEDSLAIGTSGGEWIPSSTGAVITPNDITVRRQTTHGSADVQPVRVGSIVLFVQRAKRKLREFGFSFENDGFRAPDMTRLAGHITYGGIVEIDYAQERESVIAAVRADGQLLLMTYRREEDAVGWSRQIVGGSFGAGNAVVESVSVIPGANDAGQTTDSSDRDEIWVIVKRTINGATKRYVEFFERDWEQGFDVEDAYYADSIITYDGTSTATITGLDHLEGETVKVWADGAEQTDKTVSSGSITIDTAASVVQVGLGYFHHYKGLKWDSGNPAGTAVGKIKRIHGITFVLLDTYSIKYGPNVSKLLTSTVGTDGGPLFSGELTVAFDGPYDRDSRIEIRSDSPSPFTLLAIAPETNVNRP
jgi:hypothetical protein